MKFCISFIWIVMLMASCSTTNPSVSNNLESDNSQSDNFNISLDLTERLKQYAGLRVMGQGPRATITLRGVNSISGGNEPLFILDQMQVESYADLHSIVSTATIKRIEVLTNPADLSMYGHRGSNGVIKIITGE